MTASAPMEKLGRSPAPEQAGEDHRAVRRGASRSHLKDLVVDEVGAGRRIVVDGRRAGQFRLGQLPGPGPGPAGPGGDPSRAGALGDAQRRVAGVRQRPGQHRGRGEAGRLARGRVGPDPSLGDAGEHGGDPRTGRPAGRHRHGRAGAQLDAGGRQDRAGQRREGGDVRPQRPGGARADAASACGPTARPWCASTASTA